MTAFSNVAFGIALVVYLAATTAYFHHLGFRRAAVLRLARALAWTGVVVHLASVVARGIAAGRVPWGNLYEYVLVAGLLAIAASLVVERRWATEAAQGFVLGAAVAAMGGATLVYVPPGPLVPALNSYWLRIHVVLAAFASAMFMVATVFTVLYLVRDRRERRSPVPAPVEARQPALVGADGGERPEDYVSAEAADETAPARPRRFPDAVALDRVAYRTIVFAFPIWTLAIIFGAIWAEEAWGRYWAWDPKEVWAFVTWVLYASYLHARATVGWRGTKAATLAVLGFGALVFNLVVVNLAVSSLHGYAS